MRSRKLYYKRKDKNSIKWANVSRCKNKCFVRHDHHIDSLDCRYDYKCQYCSNKTETFELWVGGKFFSGLWACKKCSHSSNDKKIINECCTKNRGSARWW